MILFVPTKGKVKYAGILKVWFFLFHFFGKSSEFGYNFKMDARKTKQIIYGTIFLAVIFLLISTFYFVFLKPAPTCFDNKQNGNETGIDCGGSCQPCELKNVKSLEARIEKIIVVDDNHLAVLIEATNPNFGVGAKDFIYNLRISSAGGQLLKEISGHSFIYPSARKYILEIAEMPSLQAKMAEVNLSQPNWKLKQEFNRPNADYKNFKTEVYNPAKISIPLYTFGRDLFMGLKGEDVSALQDFLTAKNFYHASSTGSFDLKTKKALTAFQKNSALKPINGYFGKTTRDFINTEVERVKNSIAETAEIYPVTISGTVKNSDPSVIAKIIVVGLIYDKFNMLVGASKTELENFVPGEERPFRIIFPKNLDVKTIDTGRTRIFVEAK